MEGREDELEDGIEPQDDRVLSRRRFLKLAGLTAAAAGIGVGGLSLASCSGGASASTTAATSGAVTTAAGGSVSTATSGGQGGKKLDYNGKEDLADQAAAKGKKTIAYVTACAVCARTARIIQNGQAEAQRRGWTFQVADSSGDMSKIPGLIDTFIQAKVDFINQNAIDPGALGDGLAKAQAAGIPFFFDSAPWVKGVTCSIAENAFEMGMKQAQWIVSRLEGQGNIAMLTFTPFLVVARRDAILRLILSNYPGIKIVETHTVDPTKAIDDARTTVQAWLVKYPKGQLNAVWGGWDDPASGAATAIDAAGRNKDVFVIGNDCGPDILELMRTGSSFDGDIFIDAKAMAVEMFHQIDRVVLGMDVEAREVFVNQPIISPYLNNVPPKGQDLPPAGTYIVWPLQK